MAWFNTDWSHRNKITVANAQVPSDQTDFPMLVLTTDVDWKSTGNGGNVGQTDGGDFVFTSTNGTTQLKHEIQSYDATTGKLIAWVKIPTLKGASDTDIYIYYGNATVADQADPTNVWDANYKLVMHLDGDVLDSTTNGNDGTDAGTADIAGKIGQARTFDGVSDEITAPHAGLNIDGNTDTFTISAWGKTDATTARLLTKEGGPNYPFSFQSFGTAIWGFMFDGTNAPGARMLAVVDDDAWHYCVMVVDNAADNIKGYGDGSLDQTTTNTTISAAAGTQVVTIGNNPANDREWDGEIDEVRISTGIARTADWITAEYNNQNAPDGTFYTVAAQEAGQGVFNPIWPRPQTPHSRM